MILIVGKVCSSCKGVLRCLCTESRHLKLCSVFNVTLVTLQLSSQFFSIFLSHEVLENSSKLSFSCFLLMAFHLSFLLLPFQLSATAASWAFFCFGAIPSRSQKYFALIKTSDGFFFKFTLFTPPPFSTSIGSF